MFNNLQAELARNRLNQTDIANALGISSKTVSNKMNGVSDFTLREIKAVVEIVGVKDIEYLFAESDETTVS